MLVLHATREAQVESNTAQWFVLDSVACQKPDRKGGQLSRESPLLTRGLLTH